jgi:hypothetical protein
MANMREMIAMGISLRTVASDTTDDEFALFIHWARSLRLDPPRPQVHAFVFNKHDPKKRRLSLVTSNERFRAIAASTGNYRPDENEPAFRQRRRPQSRDQSGRPRQSARSGSGNTLTGNGSPSPAWLAGTNSRRSRRSGSTTSRPSARSSTQDRPLGGHALPHARQMRRGASHSASISPADTRNPSPAKSGAET